MKNISCICLFLFANNLCSQKGMFQLLTSIQKDLRSDLILENHIKSYYVLGLNKEIDNNNLDKENNPKFILSIVDSVIYSGSKYVLHQKSIYEGISTQLILEFNSKNRIIESKLIFPQDSILNEYKSYSYDENGRIKNVISKEKIFDEGKIIDKNSFVEIFQSNSIFPDSVHGNMQVDFRILKTIKEDTIFYHHKINISQDLINKTKKELGEDATEEELSQALESFNKQSNQYSKIYSIGEGLYKEELYEIEYDSNFVKTETVVFNSNLKLLSKKDYYHNFEYKYFQDGRIESITLNNEEFQNYEYNDDKKLTIEKTKYYINKVTYKDGKIDKFYKYDLDNNLIEYSEFKFLP